MLTKEKVLIIVRGLPGSGKSTFSKLLSKAICSADDYLMVNGEYLWSEDKLYKAHKWCQRKCERFMKFEAKRVVVDNTSIKSRDLKPYYKLAEKYGYLVHSVIVENRHGGANIHNCSEELIEEKRKKFNIKL